jgi:hypothetical protein
MHKQRHIYITRGYASGLALDILVGSKVNRRVSTSLIPIGYQVLLLTISFSSSFKLGLKNSSSGGNLRIRVYMNEMMIDYICQYE